VDACSLTGGVARAAPSCAGGLVGSEEEEGVSFSGTWSSCRGEGLKGGELVEKSRRTGWGGGVADTQLKKVGQL
jgi:hypothetical protein